MEDTVTTLVHQAAMEEKHHHFNEAILSLEKARVLEENNKEIALSLSRLYIIVGKPIQALEIVINQKNVKEDSDYLLQLSNIYLVMQRFEEAESVLMQALDRTKTAPLYNNLAVVMMKRNKGEEAVKHLYESLTLDETNPNTYFNLATYYESKRDFSKSEIILLKARAKCETMEIDDRLIRVLIHNTKLNEAKTVLEEGLLKFPQSEALKLSKARILFQEKQFENALMWIKDVSLTQAISTQFEENLLEVKIEALQQLGRYDQAIATIDSQLQRPQANPAHLLKKANLFFLQGKHGKAVEVLNVGLSKNEFPPPLQQNALLMLRDLEIVNWQRLTEFFLIDPRIREDIMGNPIQALEKRGIVLPIHHIQKVVEMANKQPSMPIQTEQGIS